MKTNWPQIVMLAFCLIGLISLGRKAERISNQNDAPIALVMLIGVAVMVAYQGLLYAGGFWT